MNIILLKISNSLLLFTLGILMVILFKTLADSYIKNHTQEKPVEQKVMKGVKNIKNEKEKRTKR